MATPQGMKINGGFARNLLEAVVEASQTCSIGNKKEIKVLRPEGLRWPAAAAAVLDWSAETENGLFYSGTVTACLFISADGDVIVAFYDSLDLLSVSKPVLPNLETHIDFRDQSDLDRGVAKLADSLDEEMAWLAGYTESWDEGDEDDY